MASGCMPLLRDAEISPDAAHLGSPAVTFAKSSGYVAGLGVVSGCANRRASRSQFAFSTQFARQIRCLPARGVTTRDDRRVWHARRGIRIAQDARWLA